MHVSYTRSSIQRGWGQRSFALGKRLTTNNVKRKLKTQICERECTTIVKERELEKGEGDVHKQDGLVRKLFALPDAPFIDYMAASNSRPDLILECNRK